MRARTGLAWLGLVATVGAVAFILDLLGLTLVPLLAWPFTQGPLIQLLTLITLGVIIGRVIEQRSRG